MEQNFSSIAPKSHQEEDFASHPLQDGPSIVLASPPPIVTHESQMIGYPVAANSVDVRAENKREEEQEDDIDCSGCFCFECCCDSSTWMCCGKCFECCEAFGSCDDCGSCEDCGSCCEAACSCCEIVSCCID